jgi:hypothetical protein
MVEYENIPQVLGGINLNVTLYGQPQANSDGIQIPITNTFTMNMPCFPLSGNVPVNAVLTSQGYPVGTALTAMATSIGITSSSNLRLIRFSLIAETTQSEMQ